MRTIKSLDKAYILFIAAFILIVLINLIFYFYDPYKELEKATKPNVIEKAFPESVVKRDSVQYKPQ